MRRSRFRLWCCAAVLAACAGPATVSPPEPDATDDATVGASPDAARDVARDATVDATTDATLDVAAAARDTSRPSTPDAPPAVDARPPAPDTGRPAVADVPTTVDAGPPRPTRPTVRLMLRRVVHARAIQNLRWTIDHETPESVGRALARLRPTYVSGLVRLSAEDRLSPAQVRDFETIRRIVRETSPDCAFDVVLNGQHYDTPAAMRRKLEAVDDELHPDAWFFDFFYSAYRDGYRGPLDAAVAWAHEHRQYIGGNTVGDDSVPRSDFAALSPVSHAGREADGELDLKRDEIRRLHERGFPVLMHINNDPHFAPTTESCYFMGRSGIARFDWGYHRRAAWITERARDQADWHFRFMYPVFFPECPIWHTYNAPRDGMMMEVFADLARRYN